MDYLVPKKDVVLNYFETLGKSTSSSLPEVEPCEKVIRRQTFRRLLATCSMQPTADSIRWIEIRSRRTDSRVGEDKDRSGRPKIYEDAELEKLLEEDLFQTQNEFALTLEVIRQTVSHRLKSLGMIHKQVLGGCDAFARLPGRAAHVLCARGTSRRTVRDFKMKRTRSLSALGARRIGVK
ncbi:Mariner Mos1 transposase [Eumeta japonica]|uniref:Mariner Mos1 transposase n=1 Tax=Eumeta variegata TaxID=151549 RepID=A0A4C1TGJ2_EUMVA|nr:Mariner Mos1 transposase [Eumeta japonica]